MNAKKLLSILAFTLLLCTLLTAFALADSKVIRFDGNGTVTLADGYPTGGTVSDGIFKMDMAKGSVVGGTFQPTFKFADGNSFDLAEYPFVKIKYRTDFDYTIQFYVNDGGYYSDLTRVSGINDGNWYTAELYFNLDGEKARTWGEPEKYTGSDGKTWLTTYPNVTTLSVTNFFFQFKNGKASPSANYFAEIEYIAFFADEADMKKYDAKPDNYVLRFDDYSDIGVTIPATYSGFSVDDGILHITTTGDVTTQHKFNFAKSFNLYDYPYFKIKFKTNWPANTQFYMPRAEGGNFLFQPTQDWGSGATEPEDDKWYGAELCFPDGDSYSQSAYMYNAADGTKWNSRIASTPAFPTKNAKGGLSGFFIFYRSITEDDKAKNLTYYTDIDYIAYFKNPEDMAAFTAEKNAVDTAATALESDTSFTYTMHLAATEANIEKYVRETVEAKYPNLSVTVEASAISNDNSACAVDLTLFYGNTNSKAVAHATVNVTLTHLPEITFETLGAQIRTNEQEQTQALRFATLINGDTNDVYSNVSYGMIVIPQNLLNAPTYAFEQAAVNGVGTLKLTTIGGANVNATAIVKNADKARDWIVPDGRIFTVAVTNIPESEYDRLIIARPFIKYTANGEDFMYYGKAITRSVNGVINASTTENKQGYIWATGDETAN
ncbi:MAG: hypothetical protein E7588_08295 [Ruminococcaceae bacterium]|nr:hypothetical protein [Oscillospiraceae bacterium]